jgi:ketosteroid isomerase-like protein
VVSHEDFEDLRAEYAAMSRKDWDSVLISAHRDFELTTPGTGLGVETVHGRENARQAFEDFFSPYESLSVEPERFFEGDGQIVVFFLQRAKPAGSTRFLERRAAHLWTMRDGKAVSLRIFLRREEALDAAGLAPDAASSQAP